MTTISHETTIAYVTVAIATVHVTTSATLAIDLAFREARIPTAGPMIHAPTSTPGRTTSQLYTYDPPSIPPSSSAMPVTLA